MVLRYCGHGLSSRAPKTLRGYPSLGYRSIPRNTPAPPDRVGALQLRFFCCLCGGNVELLGLARPADTRLRVLRLLCRSRLRSHLALLVLLRGRQSGQTLLQPMHFDVRSSTAVGTELTFTTSTFWLVIQSSLWCNTNRTTRTTSSRPSSVYLG